jgi:hypothetical protein
LKERRLNFIEDFLTDILESIYELEEVSIENVLA